MDILDLLITIIPPQSIVFGLIYFLLIFYGTNRWKNYSGFEKVIFSAISGGVVLWFFIVPVSFFLNTLKVFQNELIEIKPNDLFQYSYFLYGIILIYITAWRLISNKPLRDNKTFFNITEYLIIATAGSLTIANYVLLLAFSFSAYQEHLSYIMASMLLLTLLLPFYFIFLKTVSDKENLFAYLERKPFLNFTIFKNKKLAILIILVIMFISAGAALTGKYFLKTTTQIVEKTERLVIDEMYIHQYYWQEVNISGDYQVEQNYSIKFGLIPWTKIRPNITLRDGYNVPTNPNYNFMQNSLYINNSWLNTTNIILRGIKEERNIPKFYTLKIIDLNETTQRWDIEFNNINSYPIEIYYLTVYQPPELKYIKYEKSDGLSLNEVVMENSHTIIKRVTIHPESDNINPNQSIILYFEKYSK